jgi:hypothetical protein
MALSYFFFSYFFNDGQTWGMHLFKKRLAMGPLSFRESILWASHSLLLCLSMGLTLKLKKEIWKDFKNHDYRYDDLLRYKESKIINLLQMIHESELKTQRPVQQIPKAA